MKNFFRKNKSNRNIAYAGLFLCAVFLILGLPEIANAGALDTVWNVVKTTAASPILLIIGVIAVLATVLFGALNSLIIGALLNIARYNNFINEPSIRDAWVVVRDLSNMFFILILLVIAFATILRIESYQWKKLLPKLLIMAVLINFSRTICGLIIDVSQVIMLTFVNAWADSGGGFVLMTKMTTYFTSVVGDELKKITSADFSVLNIVVGMLVGIMFLIISGIVLFVALSVFLMRVIMLWIYVVLSPFAFLAAAFPAGQKYASQWWSEFTKYIINGPVLAFFIWMAFIVSDQITKNSSFTVFAGGNQCFGLTQGMCLNNFLPYILSIGMLLGGLIITQQIGGIGASIAGKGLDWAKKLGSVPLGVGKYAGKFGILKAGRMADTLQMKGQGAIAKGLSKLTGGLYGEKYQAKSLNYRMIKEGWDRNQAAKMRKYEGTKAGAWQDQFNRTLSASAGIPIVSRVIRKRAEDKIIKNQGEIAKAEKLIEEDKQKLKDETLTSKERIDIEARIKVNDDEINKFKKENRELANVTARWGTKPPQKYARLQEQERANEKYNDIRKEDLNEEGLVHNYINEGAMDKKRAYLMHLADINGINTLFDAKGIEMTAENISEFFKKEFGEAAGDVAAEVSRRAEAVGNYKVMGFHKYDVTQGRNVVASPEEQKVFSMRKDNEKYAQNHARTTHFDSLVDRTKDGPKLSELGVEQLLHIASSTGRMKEINNGNYQTRYGEMVVKLEADINNKAKEFESQGRQTDADALRKVLAAFKENYGILGKKEKNIKSEASNDKKSDKGPVLYDAYNRPIKKDDESNSD